MGNSLHTTKANDPIGDLLSRIRNGARARLERIEVSHSQMKERVAHILKQEGYVAAVHVSKDEGAQFSKLTVVLKYSGRDRMSAFVGLRRKSRPGRRLYLGFDALPRVKDGLGLQILSTSHGLMTDREARERKVGGEVLCEVW